MRLTLLDHRNGHHTGHDSSCPRCWVRAALGRTPEPPTPSQSPRCPVHDMPDCSPLLNGCTWRP